MAKSERVFEVESRTVADECAQSRQQAESSRYNSYMLFNRFGRSCDAELKREMDDFLATNYTNARHGVGNAVMCNIDNDNDVRLGFAGRMHHRGRHQLFTRPFQSVPKMKHGKYYPQREAVLVQGEDTRGAVKKSCDVLSGVTIDRAVPMIPSLQRSVQDPRNIVAPWGARGGVPTRFDKGVDGAC
jgi:hypothetical protein